LPYYLVQSCHLVVELMARSLRLPILGRNPDLVPSLKVYFPSMWVYVTSFLVLLLFHCCTSLFPRLVHAYSHGLSLLIT
jgi:hypothetical protein